MFNEQHQAGCPPFAQLMQLLDHIGCDADSHPDDRARLVEGELERFPADRDGPLLGYDSCVPVWKRVPADRDDYYAVGNFARRLGDDLVKHWPVADVLIVVQHKHRPGFQPGKEFTKKASCEARGIGLVLGTEHRHRRLFSAAEWQNSLAEI